MANPEHLAILKQGVEVWNNWRDDWRDKNPWWVILRPELSGADLSGADLSEANLSKADLSDPNLSKANLSGADLSDANLSKANLSDANLSEANLSEANLSGANLSEAELFKARLFMADLSEGANLRGANLVGANLNGAYLSGANLSEAKLLRANLSAADLNEANLSGADLFGADLSEGANLSGADLSGADLRAANLSDANLNGAYLRGAYLNEANLSEANLSGADLSGADLATSQVTYTHFDNAILTGACIKDWHINSKTILDEVICEYVYLDDEKTERRPSYGNFDPGEFTSLYKKIIENTNLILPKTPENDNTFNKPEKNIDVDNNSNNQGVQFRSYRKIHTWENLRFRSKTEIKIAEALDRTGVLFVPNSLARLTTPKGRENKEADFLICYNGKWGVLEVDGPFHTAERRVEEQERERIFKKNGIKVVERFDAERCYNNPDEVVQEFFKMIEIGYS